jgi:hypothetical protein
MLNPNSPWQVPNRSALVDEDGRDLTDDADELAGGLDVADDERQAPRTLSLGR